MCGIIGYTDSDITALKKAHALQCHRGPDDAGFYNDSHISLGHNRLSIIDLNPRSAQPLWSTNKNLAIVFNGEIYNYRELRKDLESEYSFQTESDTEVLLALYAKYGDELTVHIRGMYAFTIYDKVAGTVKLFRDPFGIKPLYYAFVDGKLFFTSELKAMVSLFGSYHIPLELDEENIRVYLTLGYTISPNTIYKNINMMLPGTIVSYDSNAKNTPVTSVAHLPNKKSVTEKQYMTLVEEKILSNLVADVPVGVFFSGGTDSSLIAAVLHKHGQDLETFSIKMEGRDSDSLYFSKISEHLQLKNTTYTFNTEVFDSIYPEVVKQLDNPSGCDSLFQTYFIAKKASEKVKVVLMGDGGDELFLGYPRSLPLFSITKNNLYKGEWLDWIYFKIPSFKAKNFLFLKIAEYLKYPFSYYLNQMSLTRDQGNYADWKLCRKKIIHRNVVPKYLDKDLYLSDNLLFKSDAATSYCSIEGRVPFLDVDILLNAEPFAKMSVDNKTLKYFSKKMLLRYLPHELVYRKKSGFGVHYKNLVGESKFIANDYARAVTSLEVLLPHLKHPENPTSHYIFTVILLFHSLENNAKDYSNSALNV